MRHEPDIIEVTFTRPQAQAIYRAAAHTQAREAEHAHSGIVFETAMKTLRQAAYPHRRKAPYTP